jgi:hypothetical protein
MYCRVKDLKQAYKDTGLNLAYAFDLEHLEKSDPKASAWIVYWARHEKDATVKLEDVDGYDDKELFEAYASFFQKPIVTAISTVGSPTSTSASVGLDGASPILTELDSTKSLP